MIQRQVNCIRPGGVEDTMLQHPSSASDTSQRPQVKLCQNTCKHCKLLCRAIVHVCYALYFNSVSLHSCKWQLWYTNWWRL